MIANAIYISCCSDNPSLVAAWINDNAERVAVAKQELEFYHQARCAMVQAEQEKENRDDALAYLDDNLDALCSRITESLVRNRLRARSTDPMSNAMTEFERAGHANGLEYLKVLHKTVRNCREAGGVEAEN